ncbi:MAG: phosphatidylserine decarboxylase [Gammaproteobacteria bacterium]|nr:phosphatidylserine decarboxylase [Gammaproteobacteria bacterium]MCP5139030.1 phosphatidylserine decarboxylase [Chromatiales bacterium]
MLQGLPDQLFVLFQRLLPGRLLGRIVYWLARQRAPWLRTLLIRSFIRFYKVDLSEVEHPEPAAWEHANAFFTRALKPGARPVAAGAGTVVSPADGTIEELGYATGDHLVQAKRFHYRLADFLATDDAAVARFHDGAALTIYLAPHNYHRVHMPLAGQIREMVYVPGRRWAVNRRTARAVPGLFAANERVILWCENPAGRFAVVLVGAMNVASISLAWTGEVAPGKEVTRIRYPADAPHLAIPAGGLLGQFNLGSTVVIVAERKLIEWDAGWSSGRSVRMGEALGRLRSG